MPCIVTEPPPVRLKLFELGVVPIVYEVLPSKLMLETGLLALSVTEVLVEAPVNCAVSPLPGTAEFQLLAVFQSLEVLPVHVSVAAGTVEAIAARLATANAAASENLRELRLKCF